MSLDIGTIGAITGIVAVVGGAGAGIGKYYLNTSYVPRTEITQDYMKTEVAQGQFITGGTLNDAFIMRDIRDLKRLQRELERIDPNIRTEKETWQLHDIEDEIDELEQELAQ